jgi:hypothetical protein|tara:strand:- start:146 stop:574 length:429 start_codon:yes stop_codon:yes gene_type:complete
MKKVPTKFARYYVTEDGRVYRKANRVNDRFAHRADTEGFIEVYSHERGGNAKDGRYLSVSISLYDENGKFLKQIKYYTHRLIAETFIDNPNNYETVNHKDTNKQNNVANNLEWTTQADNWKKAAPSRRDCQGRWVSNKNNSS